jgi:flagellar basal body-associated protein FliL
MYWLILIGLVVLIVAWAATDIAGSVASARQAEATIETAKAAQVASAGNLVTILMTALVVIFLLALVGLVLYFLYRTRLQPEAARPALRRASQGLLPEAGNSLETLIQLETLRALQGMRQPTESIQLDAGDEGDETVAWW